MYTSLFLGSRGGGDWSRRYSRDSTDWVTSTGESVVSVRRGEESSDGSLLSIVVVGSWLLVVSRVLVVSSWLLVVARVLVVGWLVVSLVVVALVTVVSWVSLVVVTWVSSWGVVLLGWDLNWDWHNLGWDWSYWSNNLDWCWGNNFWSVVLVGGWGRWGWAAWLVGHGSGEARDSISVVLNSSQGTVRLDNSVESLYLVSITGLLLALLVTSDWVGNTVLEFVFWVWVDFTISAGNSSHLVWGNLSQSQGGRGEDESKLQKFHLGTSEL